MQISVIITTYNRIEDLDRCLDSIAAQTRLPKEILVVDNGTDKGTSELVERKKREFGQRGMFLDYIRNYIENSLTVAKNIGVRCSRGDIISFLDDDLLLDKNYYEEIIKVYDKIPNALGVTGYNYHEIEKEYDRGIIESMLHAYIKSFQVIFFFEEDRCRVLPSLCTTFAYPHPDRIVSCEWLSGSSTYRKVILETIKPDENLKKYSDDEDQDLSYRIFKKYPNSLFSTCNAKYLHKGSPRAAHSKEVIYMSEVYDLYLFYKNIDQNLKNKLIYLRSRIGRLVLNIVLALKQPKTRLMEIKYLFGALFYCVKHKGDIGEGSLEFFNRGLYS